MSSDGIIRTKSQGCFQRIQSSPWGTFLSKVDDPSGKDIDLDEELSNFKLKEDFPKIPANQWSAWINLCFELCDPANKTVDATSEVTAVFVRGGDNFNEWKILIPRQRVGAVEAQAEFSEFVDILTGEEYAGFPEGWHHAGSTHSHNTMRPFFSLTDDKYELGVPGLHVVVGDIPTKSKPRTYNTAASMVMRKRRMIIKTEDVVDTTPRSTRFHPKCLSYIEKVRSPVITTWESKPLNKGAYKSLFGNVRGDWFDDEYYQKNILFEQTDAFKSLSKTQRRQFRLIAHQLDELKRLKQPQILDAISELAIHYL